MTRKANADGVTMHVHVMGNKGVTRIVNAFINGGKDEMRNTLVHLRNVDDADYKRMAEHNINITSGVLWHHAPDGLVEMMREKGATPVGMEDKSYPMKSYFDHGINVTTHSDYPATSGSPDDPFGIMEIAVTGMLAGEKGVPYWPEYADFLLVDKDVLSCPVTEIHAAKPAATYFEGKKVYSK